MWLWWGGSYRELEYLVRWLGYPPWDDMWLKKASELANAQELIQKFHGKYFQKAQTNASRRKRTQAAKESSMKKNKIEASEFLHFFQTFF